MPTRRANTCASAASRCRGCDVHRLRSPEWHSIVSASAAAGRSSGEIAIGGAKNAALPLMAAGLLTDQRVVLTNVPRLDDIATMSLLLAQHGIAVEPIGNDGRTLSLGGADHQHRGALRHRAQDARLVPGAGAAARAGRRGAGVAARRLRHRRAADRPAPEGAGATGRARSLLDGGYIDARGRGPAARRDHRVPVRLGRRDREPADGGVRWPRAAPCWPTPRASRRSATSPPAWWRWARASRASAPTSW